MLIYDVEDLIRRSKNKYSELTVLLTIEDTKELSQEIQELNSLLFAVASPENLLDLEKWLDIRDLS